MFNDTPAQKQIGYWVSEKGKRMKWLYNKKLKIIIIIIKHTVKSCAINKISQLGLFKIDSKITFVLKTTHLVWDGI